MPPTGLLSPISRVPAGPGDVVSIVRLALGGSSPYCFRSLSFPRRRSMRAESTEPSRPSIASLSASVCSGAVSFHVSPCFSTRNSPLSFLIRIDLSPARSNGIALSFSPSGFFSPPVPRTSER